MRTEDRSANAEQNLAGFVSTIANNAMNGLDTPSTPSNQGTGITSYTHFNSSGLVDTTGTSGMVTQYGYLAGSVDAKPTGSILPEPQQHSSILP